MSEKNWYVKWEDNDRISGPMSKEEALDMTDIGSGMAFSEMIFEPYRLPVNVTEIVNYLLTCKFKGVNTIQLRRAAEMLTLLSCPRQVTATIKGGVFEVETIAQGVDLEVRNYDASNPKTEDDFGPFSLMQFGGEVKSDG